MARSVNKCIFIGNLTADPEVRYTNDGTAVANFTIACNDEWKNRNTGQKQEKTEFIRCVAWGKLGEICGEYLRKGKQVYAEGKWTTRQWQQDGQTRYMTECKLSDMQMLGGGKGDTKAEPRRDAPQPGTPEYNMNPPIGDDDIPF